MESAINTTVRNCAFSLLARREYSKVELRRKLLAREFAQEDVEKVIAKLQAENLQSDQRFTEAYVNMRADRGFGPVRISQELQRRGITHELISEYLNPIDWRERIEKVWRKKFHNQYPKSSLERAKQMTFLQYRGFTLEQIHDWFDRL